MLLIDIKKQTPQKINLFVCRIIRIPLRLVLRGILLILAAFYFLFGSVVAPIDYNQILAAQNEIERQELEQQLIDLEKQIADYETAIETYQSQGKTFKKEIKVLEAKINKLNLQIKAINLTLAKLNQEIVKNKNQILIIEDKIRLNKEALAKFLRHIYESDRLGLMAMLLINPTISDFFNNFNNTLVVQNDLLKTVSRISDLRAELLEKTEELALKRNDQIELKIFQDSQRESLRRVQIEKTRLLEQTKGLESKYQELLKTTRKTAAEIRKQIFQFFGGGEMSFGEAYQLAKLAFQATGVRAAFILAILDRESALGQNVGRCNYETAMHPTRDLPVFLALVAKLKSASNAAVPPEPILVSCPNRDGVYGGAMGPAQFLPSTWNLYADRIAELTGHNPASPWNNGDAIMGTALYLQEAMRSCESVYSRQTDIERCAAAKYYAGNRWRRYLWNYGDRVVNKTQQFQQDIDILNS